MFLSCDSLVDQCTPICHNGIHFFPCVHLLLGTVRILVRRGMSAETIRDGIEQYRTVTVVQNLHFTFHGINHRQRIESVNAFCMHLIGCNTSAHTCQKVVCHGLATRLSAHTVAIVKHIEQHRHTAAASLFPQLSVLIHTCKIERLPNRAASQ